MREKKLFRSFINALYKLMETDEGLTMTELQKAKVDMAMVCKNSEYLVKDVERVSPWRMCSRSYDKRTRS